MNHDRFYSNPTQVYWCCKAFPDGRTILYKTELREVNGWRLGAIIHTLRPRFDWPIPPEYRGPENIAFHRLAPNTDRASLRFPRSASASALAEEGGDA